MSYDTLPRGTNELLYYASRSIPLIVPVKNNPTKQTKKKKQDMTNASVEIITALPFYMIVVFCCYSLAVIGHGLATFPVCTHAHADLLQDISVATSLMRRRAPSQQQQQVNKR